VLPNGKRFAVNFGDGIGRERYEREHKASEDGVWVEGDFIKFDITRLVYDPKDLYKEQWLRTIDV